jgi:hypothetical protein
VLRQSRNLLELIYFLHICVCVNRANRQTVYLTGASTSLLVNVPLALLVVLVVRPWFLETGRRRRPLDVNAHFKTFLQATEYVRSTKSQNAGARPRVFPTTLKRQTVTRGVPDNAWRENVASPEIEAAWEKLCYFIVDEVRFSVQLHRFPTDKDIRVFRTISWVLSD